MKFSYEIRYSCYLRRCLCARHSMECFCFQSFCRYLFKKFSMIFMSGCCLNHHLHSRSYNFISSSYVLDYAYSFYFCSWRVLRCSLFFICLGIKFPLLLRRRHHHLKSYSLELIYQTFGGDLDSFETKACYHCSNSCGCTCQILIQLEIIVCQVLYIFLSNLMTHQDFFHQQSKTFLLCSISSCFLSFCSFHHILTDFE